ncbi:Glyoxylase, beta-lactamase superfamily II [Clostridium cavendishii DSM 21758]|uniref:Glyoxylase, beta-lactamase superfamily II n=1 Tax=Clostridium cavendishii DSM 21758 TaxID=1121302 RepID=A0A1M6F851_9CLOT|nr:MBL fold metallo-hydrolase [Clostridium cavendishii]SHI93860.1 Glyoxylase, beta-lactamase superfamily II [Clostridium cavendishii DSM 21758]
MSKIEVLDIKFKIGERTNTIFPVIIEDEKEMVLIDCGYPNFLNIIKETAIKSNVNLNKLTKIIITHHDFDHMGAVAEFKREYPDIKVIASKEDAPFIEGKKKSLRLQQAESIYELLPDEEKPQAEIFHKILETVENCKVDITLKDRDILNICGGIEVVATPGHMPGHISLYHKESKSMIVGDALVVENGKLTIALPQYTLNMDEALNSIKKFLDYDINRVICYHGGIYDKGIEEEIRKIILK